MTQTPAPAALAATVLLLRDGPHGVEVFMVTRSLGSRFMGGALVFPGGKVDPGDAAWIAGGGGGEAAPDATMRLAAVRELFEETGFLLASTPGGGLVAAGRAAAVAAQWRTAVHAGEVEFHAMLGREGLAAALDRLTLFARWITPVHGRLRFDTYFFAAAAPEDQLGRHDGNELTGSRWVRPAQALAEADAGLVLVVFPTRLNLMLLTEAASAREALAALAARRVEPILPVLVEDETGRRVRIPASAGYPICEIVETGLA